MSTIRNTLMTMTLTALAALGTEYFVSPNGLDSNSGTSADLPFKTLAKVKTVFKPGDTLSIMPGIYRDDFDIRNYPVSDKTTTVRAMVPGTVVIRGDIDAGEFRQSKESSRIWECKCEKRPEAVNERDTMTIYRTVPTLAELDYVPGAWFHDEAKGRLYVQTTDSSAPKQHYITFSVSRTHGVAFTGQNVGHIVIRDLIITGFNANTSEAGYGNGTMWGVVLGYTPHNCEVSGVTCFLNGGGVLIRPGKENHVVGCKTYGNYSPYYSSGGGIIVLTPNPNGSIRNCLTFDTTMMGLRYYGGDPAVDCVYENNIGFDCEQGALWMKYPSDTTVARNCYSDGALYARHIENSIFSWGDTGYFGMAQKSICRAREKGFREENELADPVNFDFRPMSDSKYKEVAPAKYSPLVYFVSNDGNDNADGNSIRTAWKTLSASIAKLKPGATLYILPGKWNEPIELSGLKDVSICGRGGRPVGIGGNISIKKSANIRIARLAADGIDANSADGLCVEHCVSTKAVRIRKAKGLVLKHSTFAAGCALETCQNHFISGCIFSALRSEKSDGFSGGNAYGNGNMRAEFGSIEFKSAKLDNNFAFTKGTQFAGRALNGMPIGHYWRQACPVPITMASRIHSTTATTANIECFSSLEASYTLQYGTTKECKESIVSNEKQYFITPSLTGLKPGTKYYYKLKLNGTIRRCYTNQASPKELFDTARVSSTDILEFETAAEEKKPRKLHVSASAEKEGTGSSKAPFRTIGEAMKVAVAGDTVVIHGGKYEETVRLRATGDNGRPLTITAAPGEKVYIEGAKRQLDYAFLAVGKKHIVIDGFMLKWFHDSPGAAGVRLRNSDNVTVSRIFFDGRGRGYSPCFIDAAHCASLEVANCGLTAGFHGTHFNSCKDLLLRNNVFYINSINQIDINNPPGLFATVRNNVIIDNTLQKVPNPVIHIPERNALIERDNCYYMRIGKDVKTVIGYTRIDGKDQDFDPPADAEDILSQQWRRQGRFARVNVTYADYCKRTGSQATSLFVNPEMAVLQSFVTFKDWEEWTDFNKRSPEMYKSELHGDDEYLDFPNAFFANNPELVKRDIGLQKKAFK